jgi:hypothetical protein
MRQERKADRGLRRVAKRAEIMPFTWHDIPSCRRDNVYLVRGM